ncbi:MAG: hypothetical protein HY753_01370 [Nitrospirae bacterium]|nr:hypothetical protein [Nitrospirota bacterium]
MRIIVICLLLSISIFPLSYAGESGIPQTSDISKPDPSSDNFSNAYAIGLISGFLSGVISPLFLSLLQHKVIWKKQKKLEIKYSIFNDAIRALSLYATDSLDPKLQSEKVTYKGSQRIIELRPETVELMEKSRGMIKAFFSQQADKAFSSALGETISIDDIPCTEFEEKRTNAILKLSEELGIKNA